MAMRIPDAQRRWLPERGLNACRRASTCTGGLMRLEWEGYKQGHGKYCRHQGQGEQQYKCCNEAFTEAQPQGCHGSYEAGIASGAAHAVH